MEIKSFESECVKLARKHNLSVAEVKKIYNYQFKLIMDAIREDFNKPIEQRRSFRIEGIGNLIFNPYIAKKLTELKLKKNDNEKVLSETNSEN